MCFDLVEFLTYNMHDVDNTEQDARNLSRAMRITHTRDLKHLYGIDYLETSDILTVIPSFFIEIEQTRNRCE